jgi:cysteine desulfurase
MSRVHRDLWANPSSPHSAGRSARAALESARGELGAWLGRPPEEVVFTSGATESNAWAAQGTVSADRPIRIVSSIEHPSMLEWGTHRISVDGEGRVNLSHLRELLIEHRGRVGLVSVMAANNETGVLQPTAEVASLCQDHEVPFHCDATQVPGRVCMDLSAPDMVSLSAHKFGGPRGVGLLASRSRLSSLLKGGAQERGMRPGTTNVAGAVGMAIASRFCGEQSPTQRDCLEEVARRLGAEVISGGADRLPNTSCLLFDVPGDLIVMALDLMGVSCSTGSACASGAPGRSHVLEALGRSGTPVRFSLGPQTAVEGVLDVLESAVQQVRRGCGS